VLAMNPTLLVGPSDWDAARMPREEFAARATALWRALPSASGVIVYGDRVNHAELAYLTHFTPKLEAALALIPRVGAPQLLVGGGANMVPAAKPLTFIEDLRALRNVGPTVAQWASAQGGGAPVLIGGASMPYALHQEIMRAFERPIEDRTDELRTLMRRKSERELAALREACVTLQAAMTAVGAAQAAGASSTAAILAGERAANRRGAQDVRTLFSLDRGRTLRPFETLVEHAIDPLQVYVAVRQFGYWAEGFATFSASLNACAQRAGDVLRSVVERMQAGERCSELARNIAQAAHPFDLHPVTARGIGNGIGLALEDSPLIAAESEDRLEPNDVYSVRVGLSDGREHAIVSAMVAVHAHGHDVLWSSAQVAA
jgi:Xaa-Pro aminopeptidase